MKILGLVASYRKLGNTELIVKKILSEIEMMGGDVKWLRLTDYDIKPCKGCLACLFKGEICKIKDDWYTIYDIMHEYDGFVIGSPTYFLGPPGIVKMIIDRSIAVVNNFIDKPRKPAIIVAIAGVKGWEGLTLPMLSLMAYSLGCNVVGQYLFYAQGPGEVLLDESTEKICTSLANVLINSIKDENYKFEGYLGPCPICHQNLFRINESEGECIICGSKVKLAVSDKRVILKFKPINPEESRWGKIGLREHFLKAVIPSRERFLKLRKRIIEISREYIDRPAMIKPKK